MEAEAQSQSANEYDSIDTHRALQSFMESGDDGSAT